MIEKPKTGQGISTQERLKSAIEQAKRRYPELTVRKELSGSRSVGQVSFIRQVHRDTRGRMRDDVQKSIGEYQARVLAYLLEQNFDAVFSEGHIQSRFSKEERAKLDTILSGGSDDRSNLDEEYEHARQRVRKAFETFDVGNVTPLQLRVLHDWGADQVYSIVKDKPVVGSDDVIELILKKHTEHGTFFSRERGAAQQVREYLDQHSGHRVALVFGAAHSFTFDFRRDLPLRGWWFKQFGERKKNDRPELFEIHFPRAEFTTLSLLYGSTEKAEVAIHRVGRERADRRKRKRALRTQKAVARRRFENES